MIPLTPRTRDQNTLETAARRADQSGSMRKNDWFPLLLAAAVAVVASAEPAPAQDAGGWRTFVSEAGRFRIDLPAAPVTERSERRFSVLGTISGRIYSVRAGELELAIEVRDLPALATILVPTELVLDRVCHDVEADVGAEEIEASAISLQGLPARDLVYRIPDDPPALERARVVLVEGRLYVVTGRMARPADPANDLDRFFESFRFERGEPGADGELLGS